MKIFCRKCGKDVGPPVITVARMDNDTVYLPSGVHFTKKEGYVTVIFTERSHHVLHDSAICKHCFEGKEGLK